MYVGNAVPGSAAGAAVWQIQRIDTASGVVIEWAGSDKLFDNIWSNREALVYG